MTYDTYQNADILDNAIEDSAEAVMYLTEIGEFVMADIFKETLRQLIDLKDHDTKSNS